MIRTLNFEQSTSGAPLIPYYNISTSHLCDTKVRRLKSACGSDGYAVYDFLVNEVFRHGSFSLLWGGDVIHKVADYWELSPERVQQIVEYCLSVGLFNPELYAEYHILTSADLQDRYIHECQSIHCHPDIPSNLSLS